MSGKQTKTMGDLYKSMALPTRFFSGFFQTPRKNFFNSETIEFDIKRGGEKISVAITDLSAGYNNNENTIFTNKEYKPPALKEKTALNSYQLMNRMAGDNPFQDPSFRANIITNLMDEMVELEGMIRRAVELQAAQVLQTGAIILTDSSGNPRYSIDFKAKATHFPQTTVTWGDAGWDAFGDIESMSRVNRNDGLLDDDRLIFGETAFRKFLTSEDYIAQLPTQGMSRASGLRPEIKGNGGTFHGFVSIGSYSYEMWTYTGRYEDPANPGTKIKYMNDNKVISTSSQSRFDLVYGSIPNVGLELGNQSNNLIPEIPRSIMDTQGGMGLSLNVWLPDDGENIFAGIGTRPLAIPTAIDTFSCLNTIQP